MALDLGSSLHVLYFTPHVQLVTSDLDSWLFVTLWATRPSLFRNRLIDSITNLFPQGTHHVETPH